MSRPEEQIGRCVLVVPTQVRAVKGTDWASCVLCAVPSAVLAEALTGDYRRDFHENRLLRTCLVEPVDEELARAAAVLRASVAPSRAPSAVDAIVVAQADRAGGATVLTSDPKDLRALARHTRNTVRISTG